MTQAEFAAVVGVKQYQVSRWENGNSPTLDEMRDIRSSAKARDLPWSDEWFFLPAPIPAPAEAENAA